MIEADPRLAKILHIQFHLKKITHTQTNANTAGEKLRPQYFNRRQAGRVLFDECHVVSTNANADRVVVRCAEV